MVQKHRGFRARTRERLKQPPGYRPTITKFFQQFNLNQRVVIAPEPSSHRGMPHPRFRGRVGRVVDRRGKSYIVEITDGNKVKRIISRPEHLRLV